MTPLGKRDQVILLRDTGLEALGQTGLGLVFISCDLSLH